MVGTNSAGWPISGFQTEFGTNCGIWKKNNFGNHEFCDGCGGGRSRSYTSRFSTARALPLCLGDGGSFHTRISAFLRKGWTSGLKAAQSVTSTSSMARRVSPDGCLGTGAIVVHGWPTMKSATPCPKDAHSPLCHFGLCRNWVGRVFWLQATCEVWSAWVTGTGFGRPFSQWWRSGARF